MTYAELLTEYIDKSGLTLGEIALRMASKKGIKIDKSYISKLKNGIKPPASEEVTKALADITGGDPERLMIAAHIEKAPDDLQEMFRDILDIDQMLNDAVICFRSFLKSVDKVKKFEKHQIDDFIEEDFLSLPLKMKFDLLKYLLNVLKENAYVFDFLSNMVFAKDPFNLFIDMDKLKDHGKPDSIVRIGDNIFFIEVKYQQDFVNQLSKMSPKEVDQLQKIYEVIKGTPDMLTKKDASE